MAGRSGGRRREASRGWLAAFLGVLCLIVAGFALGLIVGVVSREPDLLARHIAGGSTPVAWESVEEASPESAPVIGTPPDVAAGTSSEVRAGVMGAVGERKGVASREFSTATSGEVPGRTRPVAAASSSSTAIAHSVQVGAFSEPMAARRLASELSAKGFRSYVVEPRRDDRWRVRVGPVKGRDRAEALAGRLKREEHLPTWVLRERGI